MATARLHTILKERHSVLDFEATPNTRLDVAWRSVYGERLFQTSETPDVQLAAASTQAIPRVLLYVVATAILIVGGIDHSDMVSIVTRIITTRR